MFDYTRRLVSFCCGSEPAAFNLVESGIKN